MVWTSLGDSSSRKYGANAAGCLSANAAEALWRVRTHPVPALEAPVTGGVDFTITPLVATPCAGVHHQIRTHFGGSPAGAGLGVPL